MWRWEGVCLSSAVVALFSSTLEDALICTTPVRAGNDQDRKEAGGRRRTKGSFPEHLDLHLRQLPGKLCPETTFDPSSYWIKAGNGPIRFNMEFFLSSIDISIKAEFWWRFF